MRVWILAVLGGAIIIYGADWLPPGNLIIAMAVSGALATLLAWRYRFSKAAAAFPGREIRFGVVLAGGLALGLAWSAWHAAERVRERLPVALEKVELTVSGYTCSVPAWGAWSSVRQDFCVTRWHGERAARLPIPARLRLAHYGAETRFGLAGAATLRVSLKAPHGSVNSAGFRYETWLFREGYLATGTIRDILTASQPPCGWACRYHRLRQDLVKTLVARGEHLDHLALVESLAIGSYGQLEPHHWDVFRKTGTVHLVSISGLHITLAAGIVGWLVRFLLLRLVGDRHGPIVVPALAFLAAILTATAYSLLAGFTVPTQRSLIMVIVGGLFFLLGRLRGAWDAWLIAALLVLAIDPFAPLAAGFWLSFGAVACLILAFGARLSAPSGLHALVAAQVAITLGLWPALAALGLPTAPMGLIANLVAIPWFSFVVMPVLLLAVPLLLLGGWLADWAGVALDAVLGVLWWTLEQLARAADATLVGLPVPQWLPLLALVGAGFLVLLPVGRLYRITTVGLAALLLVRLAEAPAVNTAVAEPQVRVMDVGQGLAVLLRDGNAAMLYDTGPAGGGFSAVESQLLPTFRKIGVQRLDLLLLSHADSDHAGAWKLLTERMTVAEVISGEPEVLGPGVLPCLKADGGRVGRWHLQAWQAPLPPGESGNGRSCVVLARYGDYQVLLTGDIGVEQERQWLQAHPDQPPVDLLLVAHHGSRSSSSAAFVASVRPRYAVFSVGYRNTYNHPHPAIVERYREQGSVVLATADTGGLGFTFGAEGLSFLAARSHAPFWIRPPGSLHVGGKPGGTSRAEDGD